MLQRPGTHPVEEVRATHSSNSAHVVHKTQVPLSGAVHFTHFNAPKAILELPPDVLSQPVTDSHPHLMNCIQVCLIAGEGWKENENKYQP